MSIKKQLELIFFLLIATIFLPKAEIIDGNTFAKEADQYIGTRYVWGGNSLKKGVDCSGFTKELLKKHGYTIPRTAQTQLKSTKGCPTYYSLKDATIGSTLYFKKLRGKKKGHIHHTAIVTGFAEDGTPIITHAKGKNYGVVREKLSKRYIKEFAGLKRFYECTSYCLNQPTEQEVVSTIKLFYKDKRYKNKLRKIGLKDEVDFLSLIDLESSLRPFVITISATPDEVKYFEQFKKMKGVKVKVAKNYKTKYRGNRVINLIPNSKELAIYITKSLKKLKMKSTFSVGLMQINSKNLSLRDYNYIFDTYYNLEKGLSLLDKCYTQFKDFALTLECYNRGANGVKQSLKKGGYDMPYYNKYLIIRSRLKNSNVSNDNVIDEDIGSLSYL